MRGGINQYAYVRGNPVNLSDPTGLLPQLANADTSYFSGSMNDAGSQIGLRSAQQNMAAVSGGSGSGATPVSESFKFPPVPGGGSILGEFFIPGSTASILQGDNRDFDLAPNPTESRVRFGIDYETGKGFFAVNPSCLAGGLACFSALPKGQGSDWNITSVGSAVHVTGSVKNSAIGGAAINFDMLFTANPSRFAYDISRDPYPAFELTRTLNGVTSSLVKDYGVSQQIGGFACLMGYLCGQSNYQGTVPLGRE